MKPNLMSVADNLLANSSKNTELKNNIVNGCKTLVPLLQAAITMEADVLDESINYMLNLVKKISDSIFTQLTLEDDAEKAYVRAVVLEYVKHTFINDYSDQIDSDTFIKRIISLLKDTAISAEIGVEYTAPIVFAQAKLSVKLATLFAKNTPESALSSRISRQVVEITKIIKKSTEKLQILHISKEQVDQLHYVVIEESGALYESIFMFEQRAIHSAQKGGQNVSGIDIDEISSRKFNLAMNALVDNLLIYSEITS